MTRQDMPHQDVSHHEMPPPPAPTSPSPSFTLSPALDFALRLTGAIDRCSPTSTADSSDVGTVRILLQLGAENEYEWYQDDRGRSPLHRACMRGCLPVVRMLVEAGHPWHALDDERRTGAELARDEGWEEVYVFLREEGVRSEMVLGAAGRSAARVMPRMDDGASGGDRGGSDGSGDGNAHAHAGDGVRTDVEVEVDASGNSNASTDDVYLDRNVQYEQQQELLVDDDRNAVGGARAYASIASTLTRTLFSPQVMMEWERPLMERHAEIMCQHGELPAADDADENAAPRVYNVLNVGFGLGIIDGYIRQRLAAQQHQNGTTAIEYHHYIIEAHPAVLSHMKRSGFGDNSTPSAAHPHHTHVLAGRWQDVLATVYDQGLQFDAIFFDTFGEDYEALREWHDHVPNLLRSEPWAVYTFFNGLGATNPFFHDVYCTLVEVELRDVGLDVHWEEVAVEIDERAWDGVKRPYFTLKSYRLPVCRFLTE